VVESRSHPSPELETFLASIGVIERIRLGSSLKFCRVAEGSADLYPRFGPMMEWDVAAGDCIYRNSAAVGERSSPLRYDTTDRRVAGFVLGSDAAAATPVLTRD
jgi:3'(2'), 5'-bisphosphate nucleotidase